MKNEIKTGLMKIGEFNRLFSSGVIFPYKNNRGGAIYNPYTVQKYSNNWDTDSSGSVLLEDLGDGRYMLRDFHNRAEAIRRACTLGTINQDERLLVRVVEEGRGLSAYRNINAASKHSQKEKLLNPDLALGSQIFKVLSRSKAYAPSEFRNQFFSPLAFAIIDLKIKQREDYAFTKEHAHFMRNLVNLGADDAEEVRLSDENVRILTMAIDHFAALEAAISQESEMTKKGGPSAKILKILKSPHFFGFIIFDYMFNSHFTDISKTAKNVVRFQKQIAEMIPYIAMGGAGERLQKSNSLASMLGR